MNWILSEKKIFLKKMLRSKEAYLLLILVALSAVMTIVNPSFWTLENLFDVLRSSSLIGVFSVGVLVVLVSGGLDMSFTAIAVVAQYITALLLVNVPTIHPVLVFIVPCVIGVVLGVINASIIYFLNAPSIIVTIATLNFYFGVLQFFSGGTWLYNFPIWFRDFAKLKLITFINPDGLEYGLSVLTGIWILIIAITFVILKFTTLGRKIFALGGNREAAKRSGLNILFLQFFVYGYMGLLAGLASLVQALLAQTVAPNAIMGMELTVIAAVVLGGASLAGGSGSLLGTFLGVGLIAVIGNGLTLMKVSSYWHNVSIGLVIIISVSITALQNKAERKRYARIEVDES